MEKKMSDEEFLEKLNEHYRTNPPECIYETRGVVHCNEIAPPAEYGEGVCDCKGKEHTPFTDGWYHKGLVLSSLGDVAIYQACKVCGTFIERERVDARRGGN